MTFHWLKREGSDTVAVFVLGWAADYRLIENATTQWCGEECDIVALYDYRSLGTTAPTDFGSEAAPLLAYPHKHLIAWSFGVWVAERLFPDVLWKSAVALCGSPLPLDERYGLGRRRVELTLRGIRVGEAVKSGGIAEVAKTAEAGRAAEAVGSAKSGGMDEFYKRAFAESYADFETILPLRPVAECIEELENLARMASMPYTPSINWGRAIVGSRDAIFPCANLVAYWGDLAEVCDIPHYPFRNAWTKR